MKSNATLQHKLAKQNEISRQRLAQEVAKLEKVEKSDLRMLETARHRFRSRHKNLETRQPSFGSNVRSLGKCVYKRLPRMRTVLFSFLIDDFMLHCI